MTLYREDGSEILSGDSIIAMQKLADKWYRISRIRYDRFLESLGISEMYGNWSVHAQERAATYTKKIRNEMEIE